MLVNAAEGLVNLDELTVRQTLDDAGLDTVLENFPVRSL